MTNYQKIIAVFGIMLSMIALVLIWVFVINKGTIIIKADAPFTVNYGRSQNIICAETPCQFKLPGGKYTITLNKEGFYQDSFQANVKFNKTTEYEANFIFIPAITEIGQRNYINIPKTTFDYETNLIDSSFVFEKTIDITNLPENFNKILFNQGGNKAFIVENNDYWLLDLQTENLQKIESEKITAQNWDNDSNFYYFEEKDKEFFLQKLNLANEQNTVAKFQKDLGSLSLHISPKGRFSLIINKENPYNWYLINNEKKTRHKINQPEEINIPTIFSWSNDENSIFISNGDKNWIFSTANELFETVDNITKKPEKVFAYDNNEFIIIESLEDTNSDSTYIINEQINNGPQIGITLPNKSSTLNLGIYEISNKNYKINEIKLEQDLKIEKFEMKNEKLYFLADEKIYEIVLK